ncbi:MAG: HD-GYP domain-containing protein, partial [Thermodesulfobacteriota bacterium]
NLKIKEVLGTFFERRLVSEPLTDLGFLPQDQIKEISNYKGTGTSQSDSQKCLEFARVLAYTLEEKDPYTSGHSERVCYYSDFMGKQLSFTPRDRSELQIASYLHDIGKVEISSEILQKAAKLSTEEKELMDSHTVKGAYILTAVGGVLKEVVPIVIAHHKYYAETLDSNNGDKIKIPLGARVIAVADAYDAMTTDRPYRKGMPPWVALEEIVGKSGKQFDPEVVGAFKRVMSEKMDRA